MTNLVADGASGYEEDESNDAVEGNLHEAS